MDRKTYHHGDLKQQLIDNGLLLLSQEGVEGLSLRKVASMCGVSHNAPYKHFKDKEKLVEGLVGEVRNRFYLALEESIKIHPNDYKKQILEMGKEYVKFMVENPEYFKLMFLSDISEPIRIENNTFLANDKDRAFLIFKDTAEKLFKEFSLPKELYVKKVLTLWSVVHGMTILIVNKSIDYDGHYLELVEGMIGTGFE